MATAETIRGFIPFGECRPPVPMADGTIVPTTAETFAFLDAGHSYDALIAEAVKACQTCDQLPYCEEQQSEIGDLIWANGGQHPVVGAARIDRREQPAQTVDLGIPTLRVNLSRLPTKPAERIKFIRQGTRADQLKIISRAPDNAKVIAANYTDLLSVDNEELMTEFKGLLSDVEQEKALRYIVMTLCQQADFDNFSKGIRSSAPGAENPRFNPQTHNYQLNFETVALYLQEVCEIKKMGFSNPGHLAIYHSVEYLDRLMDKYGDIARKSIIRQVIGSNSIDPATALVGFSARLQQLRDKGILDEHAMERLALSPDLDIGSITAETIGDLPDSARRRTTSPEKRAGTGSKPKRGKAAAVYSTRTPVGQRAAALKSDFGDHPDVTQGVINHYARGFPATAHQELADFTGRMVRWRSWAIEEDNLAYSKIPDSFLRQHALRGDVDSYEDIVRAHKLKTLKQRFDARDGRMEEQDRVNVPYWALGRITTLFPIENIEPAAENLRSLLASGFLGYAVSELSELQDPSVHIDIDGINDPRTRQYVTFSNALGGLSEQNRILLAHLYSLDTLIYGRQFTDEQVSIFSGIPADELSTHWQPIIEKATDLTVLGTGGALPFSTIRQDLIGLILANPDTESAKITRKERNSRLATIVGRSTVHIAHADKDFRKYGIGLPADKMGWISDVINSSYPPSLRSKGAKAVFTSIANGNLVINGSSLDDFHIGLSEQFHQTQISDRHRVAAAQLMNLTWPLYDGDRELTLMNLLPKSTNLAQFVTKEVVARLPGWEGWIATKNRLNATAAAIGRLASTEFRPSQLWLHNGGVFAFESTASARFSLKSFNNEPNHGWIARRDLPGHLRQNEQGVAEFIKLAKFSDDDRQLRRKGGGILDVYYSPDAVEALSELAA